MFRYLMAGFAAFCLFAFIPVYGPSFGFDGNPGFQLAHGGGGGGGGGGGSGGSGGDSGGGGAGDSGSGDSGGDPGGDDEAASDDGDDMEEARAVEGVNYCEWRLAPFLLPPLYIWFCHDYQFPAGWEFPG